MSQTADGSRPLLAGIPLHFSGKLSILDLAEEAQIKRWLLTHKYLHGWDWRFAWRVVRRLP
ncbi:hypothetical protein E0L36_01415 [Streptomyces sp. AJS327]|uniref:hypothetical protein n=1 Tax=Streptomyces sp. AJS327 TaxID=2545265 RepID=UPI0015DFA9C2|nr:hypothetical protein [Streptomyces sp. AJS327]MBA0049612.1 hypothetical protein [Streptomyces sp. AJS327]